RDTERVDRLSLADVRRVCDSLPIRAVNLGTGENGLHPEFRAILHELHARGLVVTLTSNGYSTSVLDDEELRWLRDVEFSLDFATEPEQDAWRGAGNWRLVLGETERARRLGVAVTIVAVMMRTNYDGLPAIARVAAAHGAAFRVNVYQAVKTDAFSLTYDQFWTGFRLLLEACPLAVCSEPLVRAVLGLGARAEGCGCATVRVTPRGEVLPCVYWPKRSLTLADLERLGPTVVRSAAFAELDTLPAACRGRTLVVWLFLENLAKVPHTPGGYASLIRHYVETGTAPAAWKAVMRFMADRAAVAAPLQAVIELGFGILLVLGLATRLVALAAFA